MSGDEHCLFHSLYKCHNPKSNLRQATSDRSSKFAAASKYFKDNLIPSDDLNVHAFYQKTCGDK